MKIATLLFATYVLALACLPCADRNTCVDEQRKGVTHTNLADHEHGENEADHCSPLCVCSCCAASVQLAITSVVVPAYHAHHTPLITLYVQRPLLHNARAIWQPPKLA